MSYVTVVRADNGKGWCAQYNKHNPTTKTYEHTKGESRKYHHDAVTDARYMALHNNVQYIG